MIKIASIIFQKRVPLLTITAVITLFLGYHAAQLKIATDFTAMLPMTHEYIINYEPFKSMFGGGNQINIDVSRKDKTIITTEFLTKLRAINEDVMFVKGIDRLRVRSLISPETEYFIVNESGFDRGPIVPPFIPTTQAGLDQIIKNIDLAQTRGRLVSQDLKSAKISAEVYETGVDYLSVYRQLNEIRDKYSTKDDISIHISGFAMVYGFVHEALPKILSLFGVSILLTFIILRRVFGLFKIAILPLLSGGLAVLWSLGSARLMGMNIDPMTSIVPFLVLAIGSSHGIQMVKRFVEECENHPAAYDASLHALASLIVPGSVALLTDVIGFLTIFFVPIGVIQSLAAMSSLGIAYVVISNVFVLTLVLSYYPNVCAMKDKRAKAEPKKETLAMRLLAWIATLSYGKNAYRVVAVCVILILIGLFATSHLKVGDLNPGEAILWENSTYNQDAAKIMTDFMLGVDTLSLVVTGEKDGTCKMYDVLKTIEDYQWEINKIPGTTLTISAIDLAKVINRTIHEDDIRWQAMPKIPLELANVMSVFSNDDSELMNMGCQNMNILIYLSDHKGDTIRRVIDKTKEFIANHPMEGARLVLAGNSAGTTAARNDEVDRSQVPMMLLIFTTTILITMIAFRSIKSAFFICTPLFMVSILSTAFMQFIGLGLDVNTLPVSSIGVGVGVDYGCYIYARLKDEMKRFSTFEEAIKETLHTTGAAVFYTAITLTLGVLIWLFSNLKFQADMGLLLGFLFTLNFLGAIIVVPALVYVFDYKRSKGVSKVAGKVVDTAADRVSAPPTSEELQPKSLEKKAARKKIILRIIGVCGSAALIVTLILVIWQPVFPSKVIVEGIAKAIKTDKLQMNLPVVVSFNLDGKGGGVFSMIVNKDGAKVVDGMADRADMVIFMEANEFNIMMTLLISGIGGESVIINRGFADIYQYSGDPYLFWNLLASLAQK